MLFMEKEKERVSIFPLPFRIDIDHPLAGLETLQYLDRNDLKRYLSALVGHRDHLMNDPSYLMILHEHHLGRVKGEKKKEAE